jgi:hypothetical protein
MVEVLSPLPCKYLHYHANISTTMQISPLQSRYLHHNLRIFTLKLTEVEVVEMVEIFSMYLVKYGPEFYTINKTFVRIRERVFLILVYPRKKLTFVLRIVSIG